jgi:23S rRNA (cytosine1962-C5)-methyltransferase
MSVITLKSGREKSLLRRHPWIFSGAIAHVEGTPAAGETVEVRSSKGEFLGRAAWSPASQIRARMWTFKDEPVDAAFFRSRIRRAVAQRQGLPALAATDARRLVFSESDGLPGLIVDAYPEAVVAEVLTCGMEYWRDTIAGILMEETGAAGIFERSDSDSRGLEGLPPRVGVLAGEVPAERLVLTEQGVKLWVDIRQGHKTGFYLDQRSNRDRVAQYAVGAEVLNCFSYTGGFTLHALANGARQVLSIDASAAALEVGRQNIELNGFDPAQADWQEGDVFRELRRFRDQGRQFDLIILDPPKFAPTASFAEKAARGYKDINLSAFKLLRPGGVLATFSCSSGISRDLFQKIVAGAALDAGRQVQILEELSQDSDHPVALNFPEAAYLKGLICRVVG